MYDTAFVARSIIESYSSCYYTGFHAQRHVRWRWSA